MYIFILLALLSVASAAPQDLAQYANSHPVNSLSPCLACSFTCAAVFAGCALFCAIPADPFCEQMADMPSFRGESAAQKPSPERRDAITAAANNHVVPANTGPPLPPKFNLVGLPGGQGGETA
ncbi:MAG: hypothetical protein Q9170_006028 [Blastenia crenularia]